MKRIVNYRSGDRAEALGIVLMQSFCAIAPVPRQEDFGIVDAVATLLRREGRLLYAEDSFSIQFKSRTVSAIEYRDWRFDALLNQELALFLAHVDLTTAEIKLYSVGTVLAHPNVNDLKGLVLYFDAVKQRREDGVLHTSLGDPALAWTTASLADRESAQTSYAVMKQWLELERWNRGHRKMGMQTQIQWKTNEMPSRGGTFWMWNPARAGETLAELVPAVQTIATYVGSDVSLAEPVVRLMAWFREHGVDPDPAGMHHLMVVMKLGERRLAEVLQKHHEATVAAHFLDVKTTPDRLAFWVQSANREAHVDATRYEGSISELRVLGFNVEVDTSSGSITGIGLGTPWLKEGEFEIVGMSEDVFLLRSAVVGE
jgi:hypothetical protein